MAQSKISELLKLHSLSPVVKDELLKLNYRGRDNFRKLMSLKDEKSQLQYLSLQVNKKKKNTSPNKIFLWEVSLKNNEIVIEKNSLKKLTEQQKDTFKLLLNEMLENL